MYSPWTNGGGIAEVVTTISPGLGIQLPFTMQLVPQLPTHTTELIVVSRVVPKVVPRQFVISSFNPSPDVAHASCPGQEHKLDVPDRI